VVESDRNIAERLAREGIPAVWGDSTRPEVLMAARPDTARLLVLALPDAGEARQVLEIIRAANPKIQAAARAHDDSESAYLAGAGVGLVIMGEREIALGMADFAMQRLGIHARQAQATVDSLRAALEEGEE
jgi:monovalent cation:H+ antiporter-2, CPA2 family